MESVNRRIPYAFLLVLICLFLFILSPGYAYPVVTMPSYERIPPLTEKLDSPSAVAVDLFANRYVTDSSRNRLLKFDRSGILIRALDGLRSPVSVAVDREGKIYIGNRDRRNVEVYDDTMNLLGKLGAGDGEVGLPSSIDVDMDGSIYVADGKHNRIHIYNPDGTFRTSFGSTGNGNGEFNLPTSLDVNDAAGEITVADQPISGAFFGNRVARVQVFDMNGIFQRSFGVFGFGDGRMFRPTGVQTDSEGRILVADSYQNLVQVFDSTGGFLGTVYDVAQPMRVPGDMALSQLNELLIASISSSKVERYRMVVSAPDIAVLPAYHNFGDVSPGSSKQLTIIITNAGTATLTIQSIASPSGPFSIQWNKSECRKKNQSLSFLESCTLTVQFSPDGQVTYEGGLVLTSNDPDESPLTVLLKGAGANISPVANAGEPYSGTEGQPLLLDGSASVDIDGTIVQYEWDVDDNGVFDYTSSQPAQGHAYQTDGLFTVRLRVLDNAGAVDEDTATAFISDSVPDVNFTGSPLAGPAPLTVNFTNLSTGHDLPLTYEWDFENDGTADSTEENPSHIYGIEGMYSVSLKAMDSDGSVDTLLRPDYINANEFTLTVTVSGKGNVASEDGQITCPGDCTAHYAPGAVVKLKATASEGSVLTGWEGCDSVTGNMCALTMDTDRGVTARFIAAIALVWHNNIAGNNEIFFKRSVDGGANWTTNRLTDNKGEALNPAVAVTNSDVYVAWQDSSRGNNYEANLTRSVDGGANWTAGRLTYNKGESVNPAVAVTNSDVYVVWQDSTPGNGEIYLKRSADGGLSWTESQLTATAGDSANPAIAVEGPDVYVVWQDSTPGNDEIFLKRSADGGLSWTESQLTATAGDSANPAVAVEGPDVYVVWQDSTPGNSEIFLKRSTDGGLSWTESRLTATAGDSANPAIAVEGPDVYVVWQDSTPGNGEIYLKRSADGGLSWTESQLTANEGNSGNPSVAVDGINVYVVWQDNPFLALSGSVIDWMSTEIYMNSSIDSGGNWTQTRITYTLGRSERPSITAW